MKRDIGDNIDKVFDLIKKGGETEIRIELSRTVVNMRYILQRMLYIREGRRPIVLSSSYTLNGEYIGTQADGKLLVIEKGIMPELNDPADLICSVGFSKKNGGWYGWSHKNIGGFRVGEVIKEGDPSLDCAFERVYLEECGKTNPCFAYNRPIKTLEEAQLIAKAYAKSIYKDWND